MTINPADGYPHTPYTAAHWAGDAGAQARQFVSDIDAAMRVNYANNIFSIGRNIYPVLYVESTFDGGRYTLVTDSKTQFVHQNVDQVYDTVKAIAHVPLGVFSIMSGYSIEAANRQWEPALTAFRDQVMIVKARVNAEELLFPDGFVRMACLQILDASISFMDTTLTTGTFSLEGFSNFTRPLANGIGMCQSTAARDQVKVMSEVLAGWKEMLGPDEWNRMYVMISALWTLSQENAHELIIKATMEEQYRDTHVIISEAIPTLDDALTLLGRIVGDRIMAECVFDPVGTTAEKEDIYSLSTRRDLLSQAVEQALPGAPRGAGCPHLA